MQSRSRTTTPSPTTPRIASIPPGSLRSEQGCTLGAAKAKITRNLRANPGCDLCSKAGTHHAAGSVMRVSLHKTLTMFPLLACGIVAACSNASEPPARTVDAVAAFESATGTAWVLEFDPAMQTLRFAMPKKRTRSLTAGGVDVQTAALTFLRENAKLFKIDVGDAKLLPIVTDRNGGSHLTFAQMVGQVPVYGAQLTLNLSKDGSVSHISSLWAPAAANVQTAPTIDAATALKSAKADLKSKFADFDDSWIDGETTQNLEIDFNESGAATLVHRLGITLTEASASYSYIIDTRSGAILRIVDEVDSYAASGMGVRGYIEKSDKRYDSTVKHFEAESVGQGYQLRRPSSPGKTEIVIVESNGPRKSGAEPSSAPKPVFSTKSDRWDALGNGAGSAADAFSNIAIVDEFYARMGRNSFDDLGTPVVSIIHAKKGYPQKDGSTFFDAYDCNAGWNWAINIMRIGDGDYALPAGTKFPNGSHRPSQGCMSLAGSLATMGHEYTHGVVHATLQLEGSSDSRALNESLADIMGTLIAGEASNMAGVFQSYGSDRLYGPPLTPVRDMRDPSLGRESGGAAPDNMRVVNQNSRSRISENKVQFQRDEPHYRSNVPSHAFYLLTWGGTNKTSGIEVKDPIGWDAARDLYFDAMTKTGRMPKATFAGFAKTTIAVARERDLFDSAAGANTIAKPVICAWVAVGVLEESYTKKEFGVTCTCPGAASAGAAASESAGASGEAGGMECCAKDETDTSCCKACDVDGCADKPDGFHCNTEQRSGGLFCKDGGIESGVQCVTGEFCTGVDADSNITCSATDPNAKP
jgi:Zn-dependent metalloprotease